MSEKQWSDRLGFKFPHCVTSGYERETDGKHSRRLLAIHAALLAFSTAGWLSACAVHQTLPLPPPGGKTNVVAPGSKPSSTELSRTVVTPHSATDIQELFAKATADGEAKRYEAAASGFERAFELDPNGPLADRSLFEAAEMYDVAGKHEDALARYEQVARRFPQSPLDRVARVRAVRLLTYFEYYVRADDLAQGTAAKYPDLVSFDRLAVLAAHALARLNNGGDTEAEIAISKARDIIEAENLDAAGRVPTELAPVYYALGELRRMRAERIQFLPVPPNFAERLEQRCQLILDAQSAYSDTMRAYDSHWSAMAGYRVSELYQKLHEEMMQVPPPKAADTQSKRDLFEGAMRLRYSILLEKAKAMLDHTVAMAERTGEQSPWVLKSRQARDAISKSMAEERAALARLPYTREQLQEALDSFAKGRVPPTPNTAAPAPSKAPPDSTTPRLTPLELKKELQNPCHGGGRKPCF